MRKAGTEGLTRRRGERGGRKGMDGWQTKTLGDVCEMYQYGGNGVNGRHDKKNMSGENIIIGRVGAKCGNVHFVVGDAWLTPLLRLKYHNSINDAVADLGDDIGEAFAGFQMSACDGHQSR